jgi:hypothetical protein
MEGAREWRWRASRCMSARLREGARERSGEVRGPLGVELAFYWVVGGPRRRQRAVTSGLMAFKPSMAWDG